MQTLRISAASLAALGATAGAVAAAMQMQAPASPPTGQPGARQLRASQPSTPLVTGKRLSPQGVQTPVGSFPSNLALSPDGRFVLVTTLGAREYVSVLRTSDGGLVSRLDWNGPSPAFANKKQALYYGLSCVRATGGPAGQATVYASRGAEGTVSVLTLSPDGTLKDTGQLLGTPAVAPVAAPASGADDAATARPHLAGLAPSADGSLLYAADNSAYPAKGMRGALVALDTLSGTVRSTVELPGYPFAVAALSPASGARAGAGGKVYVSSEQRGVVSVVDAGAGRELRQIATGTQPVGLLLDKAQRRLFVANAGSDTVSIVDTRTDRVSRTILVRPDNARGLPGSTPIGLALSPDEKRLYVTVADMNAVAVIDLALGTLIGYLPVGWYPTSLVVSPDGRRLFVANAKGVGARNPNDKPVPGVQERPQYIQNIIEGTVSTLDLAKTRDLRASTAQVLANNQGQAALQAAQGGKGFVNPGIKHVFYIIKENRTYDQVLGALSRGNGDASLVLFGREVTPNQHALAERFVLLDNFYCCAEVSGDGWNWSTGGMVSEYTARNVPHGYGGRQRPYDYEGTNNGVAVDLGGVPDAARPPGGYLWDLAARHNVSFRNYGFFTDDTKLPRALPEEGTKGLENSPTKRALEGKTSPDFRQYDMTYADSEAWVEHKLAPAPRQMAAYGASRDPSRVSAWKREFADYVRNNNLPALSMIRLPRDHTSGTAAGASSPRAMVADNDYAVGQVVQEISRSPYWKSSAIVIVEDDAQNGFDHVDAHRSIAFVISPFVKRASVDSRFYNTDSALRTIELLLGMPPMTQYDATAAPLDVFASMPENTAPYQAILPAREIIGQVNTPRAYRSADSARLLNALVEESAPDEELNDILWHSIKGKTPKPQRRYSLTLSKGDEDD